MANDRRCYAPGGSFFFTVVTERRAAILARYCALLYRRCGNCEEVARRTGLDRRTVRKHLQAATAQAKKPASDTDAGSETARDD